MPHAEAMVKQTPKFWKVKIKEESKMKRILSTASWLVMAAALMISTLTACSGSDDIFTDEPQQPAESATDTYTLTIDAAKGSDVANTRALALDDKTLNATWATGENVYVMKMVKKYSNLPAIQTWATGSLTPQSEGAEATLTGTLSGYTIEAGDELTLQFPRKGNLSYRGQDGKLATIASTYDYATAKITVKSVDGEGKITPETNPVVFENQQAIVRFTLLDKAGNAINPTELVVYPAAASKTYQGSLNAVGDLTITPDGTTNVVYAALAGVSGSYPLTLTATVGDDTYTFTKSGVSFEQGKFYDITVKMTRHPFIMNTTDGVAVEKSDNGTYTLQNGKEYTISGTGSGQIIGNAATMTFADGTVFNGNISTETSSHRATIKLDGNVTVNGNISANYITTSNHTLITTTGDSQTLTVNGNIGTSFWMLTKGVTLYTSIAPVFDKYGAAHDASGLDITPTDEEIEGTAYKKFVGAGGPNESYITVWFPESWGTSGYYVEFYKDENTTVGSTVSLTSVGTTGYDQSYNVFTADIPSGATKYKVLEDRGWYMMPVIYDFANISSGTLRINNENDWGYIY